MPDGPIQLHNVGVFKITPQFDFLHLKIIDVYLQSKKNSMKLHYTCQLAVTTLVHKKNSFDWHPYN